MYSLSSATQIQNECKRSVFRQTTNENTKERVRFIHVQSSFECHQKFVPAAVAKHLKTAVSLHHKACAIQKIHFAAFRVGICVRRHEKLPCHSAQLAGSGHNAVRPLFDRLCPVCVCSLAHCVCCEKESCVVEVVHFPGECPKQNSSHLTKQDGHACCDVQVRAGFVCM